MSETTAESRLSRLKSPEVALGVVGIVVLFLAPDLVKFVDVVNLRMVVRGLTIGIAAVGLNVLLRHTKLVSFGHAAFFGAGGYGAAILADKHGVDSLFLLLVAGVLIATVLAMVIGYLSLRHTGLYFSLLTLAFGMLLFALVQGNDSYFNSTDGLSLRPEAGATRPDILGAALGPDVYAVLVYWIAVLVALLGLVVMYRIANSPFGKALDAIGQERTRAQFIGLSTRRYVWVAFVISGVYCGAAGALWGLYALKVDPTNTLYFLLSGKILFAAILGGFATLSGPLVGGIVFFVLDGLASVVTDFNDFLMGLVLVALVFGFPEGIVGSIRPGGRVYEWLRSGTGGEDDDAEEPDPTDPDVEDVEAE